VSISEEVGTTFVIDGPQKLPQDSDAGLGEMAGALKADFPGQLIEIAPKHSDSVGKSRKPGVATDFAHRPEDADGAELLKDVGVAQDGGFEGLRFVMGLVLPYGTEDSRNLLSGETNLAKNVGGSRAGISNMIPLGKLVGILGAMPDKNAEIMEPGRGADHVAVVREIGADFEGQSVQAGLVAKLIHRTRLLLDVTNQNANVIGFHETFVTRKSHPSPSNCQCGKTKTQSMVDYHKPFDTVVVTILRSKSGCRKQHSRDTPGDRLNGA
jgi:hypothetical protein